MCTLVYVSASVVRELKVDALPIADYRDHKAHQQQPDAPPEREEAGMYESDGSLTRRGNNHLIPKSPPLLQPFLRKKMSFILRMRTFGTLKSQCKTTPSSLFLLLL